MSGKLDTRVVVGGAEIDPGDLVVLDADGAVVVKATAWTRSSARRRAREAHENDLRPRYAAGEPPTTSTTSAGSSRGDPPGRRARPRRGGRDVRRRARRRRVHRAGLGSGRRIAGGDVERTATPTEAVAGAALVLSLATAAQPWRRRRASRRPSRPDSSRRPQHVLSRPRARGGRRDPPDGRRVHGRGAARDGPRTRLGTPALASGDGAERFAEIVQPLGMPVEVVGDEPGDAAGLKLLRSVFMKGVAASALESVEGAKARGADAWLAARLPRFSASRSWSGSSRGA